MNEGEGLFSRDALNVIGNRLLLTEPKSEISRRRIVLPLRAVQTLNMHRTRQQAERELRGDVWTDMGLVFPNTIGRPEEPRSFVRREFLPVLRRAGLPRIRFHDLRHTAATLLLNEGINPKVVQELLGHSHVSITLGIYGHVTPKMLQAAARTMDDLFGA